MGFSVTLARISSYISNQSANLDNQMDRLEKAKQELKREQDNAFHEWNRNLLPNLDTFWEGSRAVSFNDSRKRAFQEMQRVFQDEYDNYIHKIESTINSLAQEKSILSFAKNLTYDAELLLKKGEDASEELQGKINQIRRHLYL